MIPIKLASWQLAALENPFTHFAMYGGVATGKTYTGAHFALKMIREHPDLTGLIGANTYNQLAQATLREFMLWLDAYGFEYVINKRPPRSWGARQQFPSYDNIMTVRYRDHAVPIFTRVMSDENPLRGIQFSWYWMDEFRDTEEITHDVVISRMRESKTVMKGLATSTTNGEDWDYKRFVLGNDGGGEFGSLHVPTIESVKAGIITEKYYRVLQRAYSEMVALQELWAKHVNIKGGRAYYAAGEWNKRFAAPWGDVFPSKERPLIVGCDFNFQPAPHIWMIGQQGPAQYGSHGEWWPEHIHWFKEISHTEASTRQMTMSLITQYPNFFYRIFGDASGNRGTTSNAGETDYNQMSDFLMTGGHQYSIDSDQANPHVKDRVENMNGKFKNSLGETTMTYNPHACPQFDADTRMVGWKTTLLMGRGKLDDGGDCQRTHATDGAGYAVWKLYPPVRRGVIIDSVESQFSKMRRQV